VYCRAYSVSENIECSWKKVKRIIMDQINSNEYKILTDFMLLYKSAGGTSTYHLFNIKAFFQMLGKRG